MTDKKRQAAQRVLAYLDARTRQSNNDPEILSTVVGMDPDLGMPVERQLYAADLRALASEPPQILHWVGVVCYVGVRTTDGRTLLPPSEHETPFSRLPLPVTVPLKFPWSSNVGGVVGEVEGASIVGDMVVASGWLDLDKMPATNPGYLQQLRAGEPVPVGLYLADVLAEGHHGGDIIIGGWTAGGITIGPEYASPFERPCLIRCYSTSSKEG